MPSGRRSPAVAPSLPAERRSSQRERTGSNGSDPGASGSRRCSWSASWPARYSRPGRCWLRVRAVRAVRCVTPAGACPPGALASGKRIFHVGRRPAPGRASTTLDRQPATGRIFHVGTSAGSGPSDVPRWTAGIRPSASSTLAGGAAVHRCLAASTFEARHSTLSRCPAASRPLSAPDLVGFSMEPSPAGRSFRLGLTTTTSRGNSLRVAGGAPGRVSISPSPVPLRSTPTSGPVSCTAAMVPWPVARRPPFCAGSRMGHRPTSRSRWMQGGG